MLFKYNFYYSKKQSEYFCFNYYINNYLINFFQFCNISFYQTYFPLYKQISENQQINQEKTQQKEQQQKQKEKSKQNVKKSNTFRRKMRRFNKKVQRIFPRPSLSFIGKSVITFRKYPQDVATKKVLVNYLQVFIEKHKLNFELLTWSTSILLFFTLLIKIFTAIQKIDVIGMSSKANELCNQQGFLTNTRICEVAQVFYSYTQGEHSNSSRQFCQNQQKLSITDKMCQKIESYDSYYYSFNAQMYSKLLQGDYNALKTLINRESISDTQIKYVSIVYQIYCMLGGKSDIIDSFIKTTGVKNEYIKNAIKYAIIGIQKYAIFPQLICDRIRKYLKI